LRDAFVCVACLLIVAAVCAVRFAICELMVPAMVSAVSLSESTSVARPANLLFCANPPCADVIVPDVRRLWYASWMNGRRLIHVWSAMGLRSQSSRSRWYNPQSARRSIALMRSCWVVYWFLASVATSWTSVHRLNRISGGSCGLCQEVDVVLAHCVRCWLAVR